MYGYGEFISLGPEDILSEITQEEIFGIFIKAPIIIDKDKATYVAPYRNDKKPDCYFTEYDGRIFFVDFAESPPSLNCFSFIQKCAELKDYGEVYKFITKTLGLKGVKKIQIDTSIKEESKLKEINKQRSIKYLPRPFNNKDKSFWSKYGISRENLMEDKVIPISMYRSISRKGEPFTIKTFDIMYAYTDFNNNRVKIYRPYGTDESKWFTNCTQNDIGGINSLPEFGELLLITKSYKDYRVLKNQGITTIWFQNEGMLPNPTILKILTNRFKKIVVWFDNDETGIRAAKKVVNIINSLSSGKARAIHLDVELLKENIKDPSDLVEIKSIEELTNFCKNKKLL